MLIHHYTTKESLAAILQNQSIKFNRLDFVDDLSEVDIHYPNSNIRLGLYEFVSCWNNQNIENISLWNMYADKGRGVRISMDDNMFVTYKTNKNYNSFYNIFGYLGEDYYIAAANSCSDLYEIIYTTDYVKETLKSLQIGSNNDIKFIKYDHNEIGKYKNINWEIQQECRFKIHVQPIKPDKRNGIWGNTAELIWNGTKVSIENIFVRLKQSALENMIITVGPCCDKNDFDYVKNLCVNLPNIQIQKSNLTGTLRM